MTKVTREQVSNGEIVEGSVVYVLCSQRYRKHTVERCLQCDSLFPKRNYLEYPDRLSCCNKRCLARYLAKIELEATGKGKRCRKCNCWKSLDNFYARTYSIDNTISWCKSCCKEARTLKEAHYKAYREKTKEQRKTRNRIYILKKRYNLSVEDYEKMKEVQNNVCAICKQEGTAKFTTGELKQLYIDHCHVTGNVRGLLCDACNNGIGRFKDNINYLYSAIKYLKTYSKQTIVSNSS